MALLIQPYPEEDSDHESSVRTMLRRSMQLLHDQVHNTIHHTPHPPLETVPENPNVAYKPLGTSSQPVGLSHPHSEGNMIEMQKVGSGSDLLNKSQALNTAFSDGLIDASNSGAQKSGLFSSSTGNVKGSTTMNGYDARQQDESERASLLPTDKYQDSDRINNTSQIQSGFASPGAQAQSTFRSGRSPVSADRHRHHHSTSHSKHGRDHTHKQDPSHHEHHTHDHHEHRKPRHHNVHMKRSGEVMSYQNHLHPIQTSTRDSHDHGDGHHYSDKQGPQQQFPPSAATPARSIRSFRSLFARDSLAPGTDGGHDTKKEVGAET